MERKKVAKNKFDLARKMANMDGKFMGLSQKEAITLIKYLEIIEMASIKAGYKSPSVMIRKNAKKKVSKLKGK